MLLKPGSIIFQEAEGFLHWVILGSLSSLVSSSFNDHSGADIFLTVAQLKCFSPLTSVKQLPRHHRNMRLKFWPMWVSVGYFPMNMIPSKAQHHQQCKRTHNNMRQWDNFTSKIPPEAHWDIKWIKMIKLNYCGKLTGKDRTPGSSSGAPSSPPGDSQAGDHCLLTHIQEISL